MYQAVNAFRLRIKGKDVIKENTPGNGGQWGLNQDNYGRMWFCNGGGEIGPLNFQVPILYGGFNPGEQEVPGWREVFPLVGLADVQGGNGRFRKDNLTLNHFTATAGIDIVRVDRLPEDIRGDVLFGEPVGRLVRRGKVDNKEGLTVLRNAYDKTEFILSKDPNFRPVNIANGPDGCIYIVDMYRGIIQEGNWTNKGSYLRPMIIKNGLDKNFGRGRIWRLTHKDFKLGPWPHMLDETPAQLVAHLEHPNGWWRDTAQKLLVLKGDKSVVPALTEMARKHENHLARIHALWTLEGLGAIDKPLVQAALKDLHPQVRMAGIRLSEPLIKGGDAELAGTIREMAKDTDPNVVIQSMLTVKLLGAPDFPKFTQVVMGSTKALGVQKIGAALLNVGPGIDEKRFSKLEVARLKHGQAIYQELCYACHGFDGKGMPREAAPSSVKLTSGGNASTLGPPLGRSGDLRDADTVLRVLMNGLTGPVDGKTYDAQMVPMNTNDDAWIADAASFARNSFGNHGAMVNWMDAARVRAETKARGMPWTIEELRKLQPPMLRDQKDWKLTASHNQAKVKAAIDGDDNSRWDTGASQAPGMWFQIELPKESEIGGLILDSAKSASDYPRGYKVEVSSDGKSWGAKPIAEGKGNTAVTELNFAPVKAKFIRITQTGSVTGLFWSIHELHILPPAEKHKPAAPPSKRLLAVAVTIGTRSPSMALAGKLVAEMAEKTNAFAVDFVDQPSGRPAEIPKPKRDEKDTDETFREKEQKYAAAEAGRKDAEAKWLETVKKLLSEKMSPDALKKYDGVIFLNTSGELPLPDKQGFVDGIKSGKAFIGIHAAADTLHNFKPYVEMLGGEADGAAWNEKATVRVADRKHPASGPFDLRFEVAEEFYQFKNWKRDDVHPLMVLDPSNDERAKKDGKGFFERGARTDKDYAVSWLKEYGQGRVFYSGLGNAEDVWRDENFQQQLFAGIRWTLGLVSADKREGM
jgi:type 1 glutamine amidotransferase/mono/diheme cytochrome c family protein